MNDNKKIRLVTVNGISYSMLALATFLVILAMLILVTGFSPEGVMVSALMLPIVLIATALHHMLELPKNGVTVRKVEWGLFHNKDRVSSEAFASTKDLPYYASKKTEDFVIQGDDADVVIVRGKVMTIFGKKRYSTIYRIGRVIPLWTRRVEYFERWCMINKLFHEDARYIDEFNIYTEIDMPLEELELSFNEAVKSLNK